MSVTIDLPPELEQSLREGGYDPASEARELLLVDLYKKGHISIGYLGVLLGGNRWDAEAWLAARGVGPNYTPEEFRKDLDTLDRIFGSE